MKAVMNRRLVIWQQSVPFRSSELYWALFAELWSIQMSGITISGKKAHCRETEIEDKALTSLPIADVSYLGLLVKRIATADRGEFASEAEVASFFSEHVE
ncbi:MAG: hypothetical protein NTY05_01770 [Rhodocyclales bacterium]|nr:hypothetical protein [Rhodocyclales bacterium]